MIPQTPRPRRDIPEKDKTKEYYRLHAEWLLGLYHSDEYTTQRQIIRENKAFREGDVDEGYFDYLLYPQGSKNLEVNALYQNYPLMKPIMDAYEGEFLMNELQYSVEVVNKEAYLEKQEKQITVITEKLLKPIVKEIEKMTGTKVHQEEIANLFPDDLESIKSSDFREMYEDTALNIVKYNELMYDYLDRFKKGLSDLLNSNSVLFKVRNLGGDPVPERMPIENFIVVKSESSDLVEDAEAVAGFTKKSVSEILDLWGNKLSDEDKELLELMQTDSVNNSALNNWPTYTIGGESDFYSGLGTKELKILCGECTWRGRRGIMAKTSRNDYDPLNPFRKIITPERWAGIVEDDEKNGRQGAYRKSDKYNRISYTDIEECVLIGHCIIVGEGRQKNQRQRQHWGHGVKKLDYSGVWNSAKIAPATILRPLQIMYNTVYFHVDRILAQMGGKAIKVWKHHKPDSMSEAEWTHTAKNGGFIFMQYREEDEELSKQDSFNQIFDFGLSPQFGTLIQLLTIIESSAQKLVGQNPARTGGLEGSEGLGITKLNLQQSIITTLPIYHDMRRVIDSVLNCVVDKARKFYKVGDTRMWLGAKEKMIIEVTKEFLNNEFGIFIKNNQKEKVRMAGIQDIGIKAISAGGAEYLDFILEIVSAETSVQAKAEAKKGFAALREASNLLQKQGIEATQRLAAAQEVKNQIDQMKIQGAYKTATDVANINKEAKLKDTQMKLDHDATKDEITKSHEKEMQVREKILETADSGVE